MDNTLISLQNWVIKDAGRLSFLFVERNCADIKRDIWVGCCTFLVLCELKNWGKYDCPLCCKQHCLAVFTNSLLSRKNSSNHCSTRNLFYKERSKVMSSPYFWRLYSRSLICTIFFVQSFLILKWPFHVIFIF